MPTLKDFGAYQIRMYYKDHNPPHVHVVSPDETALVRILDGAVIRGDIKPVFLREAQGWIEGNKDELLQRWSEFRK